jgi:hypothetical protein
MLALSIGQQQLYRIKSALDRDIGQRPERTCATPAVRRAGCLTRRGVPRKNSGPGFIGPIVMVSLL